MFGKNKKKAKKEAEKAALQETVERTKREMQEQLLVMQKHTRETFSSLVKARSEGHPAQEKTARAILRRCLAEEKQIRGMILSLELAVQARDLAALTKSFIECVGEVSRALSADVAKTDTKRAEAAYMRGIYAAQLQEEKLDRMLSMGAGTSFEISDSGKYAEFDGEIDEMLKSVEGEPGERGKLS